MTGSSINFAPVHSAQSAVSHADRSVAPSYLLSPDRSLGTICVLDDHGKVAQTLDAKMAIASRQARAAKNFSPLWEGVLNLPRPDLDDPKFNVAAYKKHCVNVTNNWVDAYEKATSHKVLRIDIHLDEGRVEDGITLLNAHAHIISDKTNDRGKVHIINRKEMRVLQTLTAEVTQLERGQSSLATKRKHLNPSAFKAVKKEHEADLKELEAKLTEQYKADREALKASGEATQKKYQELKIAHEQALADLKASKLELEHEKSSVKTISKLAVKHSEKSKELEVEVGDLKAQIAVLETQYKADREALKASGEAKQQDYKDLKAEHEKALAALKEDHKAALEKLTAQAWDVITPLQTEKAKNEQALKDAAKAYDDLKAEAISIIQPLQTEVKTMTTKNAELAAEAAKWKAKAEHYEAEKAKGTPAHLIETTPVQSRFAEMAMAARAQRAAPPAPLHGGGNTMLGNEKAEGSHHGVTPHTPESRKTTPAPAFSPSLGGSVLKPEKTLVERLNESFMGFLAWIKGEGGKVEHLQDGKNYYGRVVQLDDLHCVQSVGQGKFAIHALDKLDIDPDLDNPKTEIHYSGGFAKVLGNGAEQHKHPVPGGRG